jgi:O-antigen/teichoic acid export membrane protein
VLQALGVGWGLIALGHVASNVCFGLSRPGINTILRGVQGFIFVLACALFVPRFSAVGGGYAIILAGAVTVPVLLVYVARMIGVTDAAKIWIAHIKPLLVGIAPAIAVVLVRRNGFGGSIAAETLTLFAMLSATVGLALITGIINAEDRKTFTKFLRSMVGTR